MNIQQMQRIRDLESMVKDHEAKLTDMIKRLLELEAKKKRQPKHEDERH